MKDHASKALLTLIAVLLTVNLVFWSTPAARGVTGGGDQDHRFVEMEVVEYGGIIHVFRQLDDGTVEGLRLLPTNLPMNAWLTLPPESRRPGRP